MLSRRRFLTASASAGLACAAGEFVATVQAQTALSANARLLVGFPPGGAVDVVARLLVDHLKGYAPSLIVDNRPGAGGRIALEALKSGEGDGSLLALTPGDQITLFPHVYQTLSYNPLRDFVPVAAVCTFPFVLAIGPMVPANVTTLAQFIDWCRANPQRASYGSPGAGTRPHFLGATLARAASFEFVHVPYKGGPLAIQDLLGGQVPAGISVLANALPHVQSGGLRALAVTAPRRSPLLPDVPTIREVGYPEVEAVEWFGIFVPARTQANIVGALHASVQQALATEQVRSGLARHSFDVAATSPTTFAELIKNDTEHWRQVVRASGFKPSGQ